MLQLSITKFEVWGEQKKKEENLRDGRITVIIGFFLYGMHKEYV